MYPVVRMFWQLWKHRNDPKLGFNDEHVSSHLCLPWDIDIWMELNNGRTLTLYDLGRIPLGQRTGLVPVLGKGLGPDRCRIHRAVSPSDHGVSADHDAVARDRL